MIESEVKNPVCKNWAQIWVMKRFGARKESPKREKQNPKCEKWRRIL